MPDGASLFSLLFSKKARAAQTFNDFVETEEYEKGFSKHYQENLLPLLLYAPQVQIKFQD